MHGRRSRPSSGASWHRKISFYYISGSVVILSSYWYDTYLQWWSDLLSISIFFPSLLLVFKLQSFILFIFNFWYWSFCRILSNLVLLFFLCSLYKSFIGFQFYQWIQIDCIIFSIWSLLFWFLIFFLVSFVKVIILFNFTLQSKYFI
jgi:hypothetical protein